MHILGGFEQQNCNRNTKKCSRFRKKTCKNS